ncbi:MAG: hypothetical protein BWY47_00765 [Bacteroidetes bacterium ADurb.Bin302]|nr:MAG: hypothetical protein BWY47_00765 [Bacteroidetes bacterium ADurb.Bin302]
MSEIKAKNMLAIVITNIFISSLLELKKHLG